MPKFVVYIREYIMGTPKKNEYSPVSEYIVLKMSPRSRICQSCSNLSDLFFAIFINRMPKTLCFQTCRDVSCI